mmetsp:Transcript_100066/g.254438  ORF Transcript_100066/g.254438 Transcript_100066/m.254438 type:complete len:232 (+) Transcript_100066:426-1121(+)
MANFDAADTHASHWLPTHPAGLLLGEAVHEGLAARAQVQHWLDVVVVALHDVALENLDLVDPVVPEHAEVVALLHLDVLEAPVHHVLLLELEQLHVPRDLREDHLQHQPRDEEHVLEVDEQNQLLRVGPIVVLVRREDQQQDVGGRGQDAVHVEGRAPGLVAPRLVGHGPLLRIHQRPHVHADLNERGAERREAYPRRGHGEESREAVREQNLVEVAELVVLLPLRLLLRG